MGEKKEHYQTGSSGDPDRHDTTVNHSHTNHDDIFEGLHKARPYIIKFFGRVDRIGEKVDEAFGGQPFWPDLPPDAPANKRRFKAYTELHEEGVKLFSRALELWMLSYGLVVQRNPDSHDTRRSKRGPSKKS